MYIFFSSWMNINLQIIFHRFIHITPKKETEKLLILTYREFV